MEQIFFYTFEFWHTSEYCIFTRCELKLQCSPYHSGKFHTQVVLVYLQSFQCNSLYYPAAYQLCTKP